MKIAKQIDSFLKKNGCQSQNRLTLVVQNILGEWETRDSPGVKGIGIISGIKGIPNQDFDILRWNLTKVEQFMYLVNPHYANTFDAPNSTAWQWKLKGWSYFDDTCHVNYLLLSPIIRIQIVLYPVYRSRDRDTISCNVENRIREFLFSASLFCNKNHLLTTSLIFPFITIVLLYISFSILLCTSDND